MIIKKILGWIATIWGIVTLLASFSPFVLGRFFLGAVITLIGLIILTYKKT